MLSQARRFVVFAALTSLLTLSFAPPAAAQSPSAECERQYFETHGTLRDTDCDGDGIVFQEDSCPEYGPANGTPPTNDQGCKDPDGPDGDSDTDGVLNKNDRCPSEGPGSSGLDASGCPITDGDGDGVTDAKDGCRDQPAGQHESEFQPGCPAPPVPADVPPADGPSCTKTRPCIVLQAKGLGMLRNGDYVDPDATVTVTIARDARGNPARIVDIELSKVDTYCYEWDQTSRTSSRTPGPELSANLDPLALKKFNRQSASGGSYPVFIFADQRVSEDDGPASQPVRTINGLKHNLDFYMDPSRRGYDQLSISGWQGHQVGGRCTIDFRAELKRITTAAEKKAVKKAVAKCKKKPTDTKKQRRKLKKCLKNARD